MMSRRLSSSSSSSEEEMKIPKKKPNKKVNACETPDKNNKEEAKLKTAFSHVPQTPKER